jgi:hypothetical protein
MLPCGQMQRDETGSWRAVGGTYGRVSELNPCTLHLTSLKPARPSLGGRFFWSLTPPIDLAARKLTSRPVNVPRPAPASQSIDRGRMVQRALDLIQAVIFHAGFFGRLNNAHVGISAATRAAEGLGAIVYIAQLRTDVQAHVAPADIAPHKHWTQRLGESAEGIRLERPRTDHIRTVISLRPRDSSLHLPAMCGPLARCSASAVAWQRHKPCRRSCARSRVGREPDRVPFPGNSGPISTSMCLNLCGRTNRGAAAVP